MGVQLHTAEDKKIYIVLSMSGTGFSKFLRLMTQKPYTHVSVSLLENIDIMYSFGRRSMIFPIKSGFIYETFNKGVLKKYNAYGQIFELSVTEEQYGKLIVEIEKFVNEYKRFKYNFIGLPFIMVGKPLGRKHHFVCSQFVASVIENCGIHKFSKNWSLVRPMDFLEIEGLRLVYSGDLRTYNNSFGNYEPTDEKAVETELVV